jgi:hypothetical protein
LVWEDTRARGGAHEEEYPWIGCGGTSSGGQRSVFTQWMNRKCRRKETEQRALGGVKTVQAG